MKDVFEGYLIGLGIIGVIALLFGFVALIVSLFA